jgi:ABC-type lipoprotein export system ATPase subunit
MSDASNIALKIRGLEFGYGKEPLLEIDELQIQKGEHLAVIGPSGCGKTTFMHLVSGLIRPQVGTIEIQGCNITRLKEWEMDRFRGRSIGVVFQRLHLLSAISVLNNLLLAQRLARMTPDKKKAMKLLDRLGIAAQAHSLPAILSQGQAQRAAIARAVIHNPSLVIGDEPTSALDNASAADAIQLIKELSESVGFALLIVTHDERVRGSMDRVLDLGGQT